MCGNQWNQSRYMYDQIKEIEIYKWIESEKAGYDLGSKAVREWIEKYAKEFREKAIQEKKYIEN